MAEKNYQKCDLLWTYDIELRYTIIYDEFVSGVAETEMEIALQDSDSGSDDHESECTTEMYV